MINSVIQNEINRQFREVSTLAMIESLKRKEEKKQVIEQRELQVQKPLFEHKCDIVTINESTIILVCALILKTIIN